MAFLSEDITYCDNNCNRKECYRHPSNIKDKTIPHSFALFYGTPSCGMTVINLPVTKGMFDRRKR